MAAVPAEEAGQGAGVINMARFLSAAFVIAAETILYVGQGVATLDEHLDRVGQVERAKLDRVLTGSPSALYSAAMELDPSTKDAFVYGSVSLPDRERRLVLGIVRQFEGAGSPKGADLGGLFSEGR